MQVHPEAPMDWSAEQERALRAASKWFDDESGSQVYYIAGYAGVGKTTIAQELANASGQKCLFAAYTGKAAYVMRRKGCDGCTTIHSLIYKPAGDGKSQQLREIEMRLLEAKDPDVITQLEQKRDEIIMNDRPRPMWTLNFESQLNDADAVIIDECSMVDETMGADLLSFGKKILVLGDPAQLPPVGSGGYFTNRKPDQLLTEVHRHAKESGILRLATDVRETGSFSRIPGYYGSDCRVGGKGEFPDLAARAVQADQILVGKNATRHISNSRFRELTEKGTGLLPVAGDKVVCLRNNHKAGLLNGSLWRVHEVSEEVGETIDLVISSEEDGANGVTVSAWTHHFYGKENELKLKRWQRADYNEFDYGYALTVHKAQGSQWDDVLLFDESHSFRADRQKWLYTGVTRAAKTLTVVL